MKKYKLNFSLFTKSQLDDAIDYHNAIRESLGDELYEEVINKAEIIEEHPFQFRKSEFGTRVAVLKRFPYRIFHRINNFIIEVIAILHQSRDTKFIN